MTNSISISKHSPRLRRSALFGLLVAALLALTSQPSAAHDGFADVIDKVMPAVVSISTKASRQGPTENDLMFEFRGPPQFRDFFDHFFGAPLPQQPQQKPRPNRPVQGSGSGFVVDKKGWIITNYHVIADTVNSDDGQILVTFHDGRETEAELFGFDELTDIALLKIDPDRRLTSLTFSDSDQARVGDWVVAIGNPFGFGGTSTVGIISSFGRDLQNSNWGNFIQTDAAINMGNSGGPLLNIKGEVIGINTAIWSPVQANIGIGFAIPSNTADSVVSQLKAGKKPQRGWLGVHIQPLQEEIADSLGRDGDTRGALVTRVAEDSPAEKAGIEEGDLIVSYNQKRIRGVRQLISRVSRTKPGERASIQIWRDGQLLDKSVRIDQRPENVDMAQNLRARNLGLVLKPLSPKQEEEGKTGIVVQRVSPNSLAQESRLREGDIIVRVERESIQSLQHFDELVSEAQQDKRPHLLLLVQRGNRRMFTTLYLR